MQAVVIGCGRVGSSVATRLEAEGWQVAVVDEAVEAFERLPESFAGGTFHGHALDLDVLREAGVEAADACVVATNGDNTNLVVAQVLERKFGVPYVVVRVLDPVRAALYEDLGLHVVCPTRAAIDQLASAVLAQPTPAAD